MTSYRFQYSADISLAWVEKEMRDLVFPDITRKGKRIEKPFNGVMASINSIPVGLVIGLKDVTGTSFRIMSLKVKPDHQHRGVGIRLLKALEDSLRTEGIARIDLQFRSHWETKDILKKMLTKLGWAEPEFHMRICQSKIEQAFPVFHSNHSLPEGYTFEPYNQVNESEWKAIRERKDWYPEDVSPFLLSHMIEPNVSSVLRYESGIVGWLVIHKITEETLEYTSLFLDENHRTFKLGHLLMGHGIDEQAAQQKFPKFLFTVKAENKVMVRFIERNGPSNGMVVTDVYNVQKEMD